jgi:hypothetical protein
MANRFGADFSDVRVHAAARAADSAAELNASAYTVGRDVVFGAGRYDPAGDHGRRLLAHELTHTLQQGAARPFVQRDTAPGQAVTPGSTPAEPMKSSAPPPRPDGDAFFTAYKVVGYNRWQGEDKTHEVWKFIGGSVGKTFDGGNTCATRVSYGMNYGGYPIKGAGKDNSFFNLSSTVFEGKAGDDKSYIVGAPQMADYFGANYGPADARIASGEEARAFQKTLASGQCAVFAGPHHSGVIKDAGYEDPYVFTDPGVMPVRAWKLAPPSAAKP